VKKLIGVKLKFLVLCLLISGCAGSPRVIVNKNVTVDVKGISRNPCDSQNAYFPFPVVIIIETKTESEIPVDAEIDQDISPDTTITPGF